MHVETNPTDRSRSAAALRKEMTAVVPSLEARALHLARSRADAEDLVQETILRALRFEDTFEPGTNLKAWMHQILHSVFISGCRRKTRERLALSRFAGDPTTTSRATPPPVLHAVSGRVDSAFRALPDKFQSVVALVDLSDHSYREAADELGIPVGTVMSRLFRARRLLSHALEREPRLHDAA